jgi:hypothetical protein
LLLEHFTYGIEDGSGYRLHKTDGVTKLLPDDKIKWLMHVGDDVRSERVMLKVWEKEQVAAYIYAKPAWDSFGRRGFWSHTILVRLTDLIDEFGLTEKLKESLEVET